MNQHLETILNFIQQSKELSDEAKNDLLKDVVNADGDLQHSIRELKIEAALERVRDVAMSMNKPDDLLNICETMYREFNSFGFTEMRNAMINIHDDENKTFVNYDYSDTIGRSINHLRYDIHPVIEKQVMQMRSATDAFSETVFEGEDLANWKKFRQEVGEKDDPRINEATALYYYFYSIGTGSIGISSFTPVKEKKLEVLKRFRNVFDLSYKRYTDLALAETQAREAQIELALERVRARTMAMQHSDELKYAATLLFQQVKALGVPAYSCGYNIWEKGGKEFTSWMSTQDGTDINGVPNIPLTEDANFIRYVESKQNGEPFFILELRGERMQEHYAYLKTIPAFKAYFDYAVSVGYPLPETQIHHLANFSHGNLLFITLDTCPEFHDVFKRFAAVFEQTYTRFLDLQKAEAQAREAQIETALEKVRSHTMAMQKSEELKEVIQVVYDQFVHLNIHVEHTGFIIEYKEREDMHIWLADKHAIPFEITIPYFDSPHWNSFNEAKATGKDLFINTHNFEEKNKFYKDLFKHIPGIPEETKEYYFSCPGLAISTVLLDNVGLYIENFSGIPYSEDQNKTLMRFGKVFQQTYTRFLDLQKAEAYAEKAKIEEQKLREEKKRSDALLLNILPEEIANELKLYGKSYARKHEEVTILFCDIKGFSTISENLSADELVTQLDECFRAFDKIVEKHGLEKIKTVGDAYICACGLPTPVIDNATKTVRAAIDMLDFLKGFNSSKKVQDLPAFEFRIGIHTGPVVTGVVGLKKFTYDIWGDAVNMAARMEQHGEAGRINVSGNTYQLIKDKFTCTPRGKIYAKNKGEVDMYFVDSVS